MLTMKSSIVYFFSVVQNCFSGMLIRNYLQNSLIVLNELSELISSIPPEIIRKPMDGFLMITSRMEVY